ncbi:hypothetical protein FSP39_012508 [Pinctada imbricata]|uniref:DUF6589 domain-containing protein n=1 Tax=Pinctada imbricata TaxID=66713 RepID=A0AA88XD79_PINIB|nr:hypothetical protein FSP39_012508 [Pinctada imbricata]
MEGAKDLKRLSLTPQARLEHLDPIVCELWHLKQDLLEKLFKRFFDKKSSSEPGTLSHLKTILKKSDVNGKVKSNFRAHSDFINLIITEMIVEQAKEFVTNGGFDNLVPDNITAATKGTKTRVRDEVMNKFMNMYMYNENDNDTTRETSTEPDELYNYCCQLCQWGLHFMALDNTASEGDIMRVIPNLMKCIPFLFSHSKLSKYLVECLDVILKCKSASTLTRTRILEGFFVNRKGGVGKNVEADLVQEHFVRNQKELIRGLGANKTDKAILRVTGAANAISHILEDLDTNLKIPTRRGHHSPDSNEKDISAIRQCFREIHPFKVTPGRKCSKFKFGTPEFKVNTEQLLSSLETIIQRISNGLVADEDDEEQ